MKTLILRDDIGAAARMAHHLSGQGFQTLCATSHESAQALILADTVDLIIMDERVGAHLTHRLALSAERRNPYLSTIIMTDRQAAVVDDLYALIPSLYALLGMQSGADLVGKFALSAVANDSVTAQRIAWQIAQDDMEQADSADFWLAGLADDLAWPEEDEPDAVAADLSVPVRITPAYPPRWGDFAHLRPHLAVTAVSQAPAEPDVRISA